MEASAALDYASRPLPLYYALSQAGRAILAAHADEPDAPSFHGLYVPQQGTEVLAWPVKLDGRVGPDNPGEFQAVARTVGSAALNGEVSIGRLLATLPEIAVAEEIAADLLKALPLAEPPEGLFPSFDSQPYAAHALMVLLVTDTVVTPVDLNARLAANYPGAPTSYGDRGVQVQDTEHGRGIVVKWPRPEDGSDPRPEHKGGKGLRWLRPSVFGNDPAPSVLMTWWAALLGLSCLARYHPVEWVRAVNRNDSTEAVVLERTLDAALDVLPGLILGALVG
jgi:hypothetical protein